VAAQELIQKEHKALKLLHPIRLRQSVILILRGEKPRQRITWLQPPCKFKPLQAGSEECFWPDYKRRQTENEKVSIDQQVMPIIHAVELALMFERLTISSPHSSHHLGL